MLVFDHKKIHPLMCSILQNLNIPEAIALDVVEALVQASLRGTDSHGINLFPHYCMVAQTDRINNAPEIKIHKGKVSCSLLDGDHGFGHYVGMRAMDEAMAIASETGIGAVAVGNSSHFASAAYYGLYAARKGFIGLSFTNADALVKVPGSTQSFFGTNPICFCAPMADEDPFCLDMATSQVSWNKILNHRRNGEVLPPDLAFDQIGNPAVDANSARSLAPTGDYKGFGLGMMVEILCGMLAGGPVATELKAMYIDLEAKRSISHFMLALDISSFQPLDAFKARLQSIANEIRILPRLNSTDSPCIPGDPEKRSEVIRAEIGIPIDDIKFAEFKAINLGFSSCLKQVDN